MFQYTIWSKLSYNYLVHGGKERFLKRTKWPTNAIVGDTLFAIYQRKKFFEKLSRIAIS